MCPIIVGKWRRCRRLFQDHQAGLALASLTSEPKCALADSISRSSSGRISVIFFSASSIGGNASSREAG